MKAVSNAGPLIHLSWIRHLDLLREVFDEVIVPARVRQEVLQADRDTLGVHDLRAAFAAGWIETRTVADRAAIDTLATLIDQGEAEAIVLAHEVNAEQLLLDDRRARNEAQRQGLLITGTVGLLREARNRGVIVAVTPLLIELRRLGFWSSDALLDQIQREENGEAV